MAVLPPSSCVTNPGFQARGQTNVPPISPGLKPVILLIVRHLPTALHHLPVLSPEAGAGDSSASCPVLSPQAGAGGSSASLSCPQPGGWCRWQFCIPVLSSVRRLVPVAALHPCPVLSLQAGAGDSSASCPVLSPQAGAGGSSASCPVLSPQAGAGGSSASLSCPQSAGWYRWQLCITVLSSARRLVPMAVLHLVLSSVCRLVSVAVLHHRSLFSPEADAGGSSASLSCPQPVGWYRWQLCIPVLSSACRLVPVTALHLVLSSARRLVSLAALPVFVCH